MGGGKNEGRISRSWDARRSLLASNLPPVQKLILMGLDAHAPIFGAGSHPSKRTLARIAGCGERTVYTHLKELEEKDLIRCTSRRPGYATEWQLNMDAILALGSEGGNRNTGDTPANIADPHPGKNFPPQLSREAIEGGPPATQTAGGPATQIADEGVALQEGVSRAHAQEAKPKPTVPDLPSIDWDGDLEQLGAELWKIAAASAGRVRIRLPGEIFEIADLVPLEFSVDVLTAGPDADSGRTVVLWSGAANLEEGIQRGLKVSAYLKHWLTVVQKFRAAIAFRDGDWSQGQWTRYPGPNVCFREITGRARGVVSRGLLVGIALAAAAFLAGFGAGARALFREPGPLILPTIEVRPAIPGSPTATSWELAYFDLARQCEVLTVGDSIGRQLPARAP